MYDPYSQIPVELESSLDEKPRPDLPEVPMSVENACYDQPLGETASPRPENPYLDPVKTARADNPANSLENPMNSSTELYAHIQ